MSKKKFNPGDWSQPRSDQAKRTASTISLNLENDIEALTQRVEKMAMDIAPNYQNWRDLGFSIATFLGESGREYYHRLSRFYHNYTRGETDKQYDKCLKSNGNGITIKTFYHLAKQAGVSLSPEKSASNKKTQLPNIQNGNWQLKNINEAPEEDEKLPTFDNKIYDMLPNFLARITANSLSVEDTDLLLLGSITTLSACLPNIIGQYGGITVYPNLFLYVTAQASAGKGRLALCRRLVEPIHKEMREQNEKEVEQYRYKLTEYAINKKSLDVVKPEEPPLRVLFIPANSSATAVFQILNDNDGVGLMFETEGDTLAQTFKSEHGNYSDGFRKAFHHEKISYLRRKDKEYVTLEAPRLSVLLSGTPRQVQSLIPDSENGLFSRFIFYYMNMHLQWYDVFALPKEGVSLDSVFDAFGNEFFELDKKLQLSEEIQFTFSTSQQKEFNSYFKKTQLEYYTICGEDYVGTVRRLGLIAYRIALVLSAARLMEVEHFEKILICDDRDFQVSMLMVKTLIIHACKIFNMLPKKEAKIIQTSSPKHLLLNNLPNVFTRAEYLSIAESISMPLSTADKQIKRYLFAGFITKSEKNQYRKLNKKEK